MNRAARLLATSEAALAIQLVLQLACGCILAFSYKAEPGRAHAAAEALRAGGLSRTIVGIHSWGAQLALFHSIVHVSAMLWTGSYRGQWKARWYVAICTCVSLYALVFTGSLLPWDGFAVRSANTAISSIEATPLFGPTISDALLRGPALGPDTLASWYTIHAKLLPIALVVLCLLFYVLRPHPDDTRRYKRWAISPALLSVLLGLILRTPLGATAGKADLLSSSREVAWFAWPFFGSARAFGTLSPDLTWIGWVVVPALVLLFLLALPRLCDTVTPIFVQTVFLLIVAALLMLGVLFGGRPASPLDRDGPAALDARQGDSAPGRRGTDRSLTPAFEHLVGRSPSA